MIVSCIDSALCSRLSGQDGSTKHLPDTICCCYPQLSEVSSFRISLSRATRFRTNRNSGTQTMYGWQLSCACGEAYYKRKCKNMCPSRLCHAIAESSTLSTLWNSTDLQFESPRRGSEDLLRTAQSRWHPLRNVLTATALPSSMNQYNDVFLNYNARPTAMRLFTCNEGLYEATSRPLR